ncbi:MAG: CBS domain-containing protein [Firmicutes bacterium]|nr:CBS domain-containing protein [Bacillota bacterium]
MKKKPVRDVMVPLEQYPSVHVNSTLAEAIKALKNSFHIDQRGIISGQRSLLVLNEDRDLVGILTIRSMLDAIKVKSTVGAALTRLFSRDVVEDNAMLINVSEVMRPVFSNCVDVNDNAAEAVQVMLTGKVNIIPVMEGDKAVGIIRSVDLFNIIGELLE